MSNFINFIALWSMDNDNVRIHISPLHVRISNNIRDPTIIFSIKRCATKMQVQNIYKFVVKFVEHIGLIAVSYL